MEMVRRELKENPSIDNATLFEKARSLDPSTMEGMDRRQFNARYPLQIKRREMPPRPKPPGPPKPRRPRRTRAVETAPAAQTAAAAASQPAPAQAAVQRSLARDGVRDVLLRFAHDLAKAESRGELVSVVAGVDRYVDQIVGMPQGLSS